MMTHYGATIKQMVMMLHTYHVHIQGVFGIGIAVVATMKTNILGKNIICQASKTHQSKQMTPMISIVHKT